MKHLLIFTLIVLFVSLKLAIAQKSPKKEDILDEVFILVEEYAEPEGGMEVFYRYIGHNLQYPQRAREEGIEGKVFVQFVVEKDGSFDDITIVKGIDPDCNAESMRVFTEYNEDKNAPKWKPAKQKGKPVRQKMVIPINFKLPKQDKNEE